MSKRNQVQQPAAPAQTTNIVDAVKYKAIVVNTARTTEETKSLVDWLFDETTDNFKLLFNLFSKDDNEEGMKLLSQLQAEKVLEGRPEDSSQSRLPFKGLVNIGNRLTRDALIAGGVIDRTTKVTNAVAKISLAGYTPASANADAAYWVLLTIDGVNATGILNFTPDELQEMYEIAEDTEDELHKDVSDRSHRTKLTRQLRNVLVPVTTFVAKIDFQYDAKINWVSPSKDGKTRITKMMGYRKGYENTHVVLQHDVNFKTYAKMYEEEVTESIGSNSIAVEVDDFQI